MRARRLLFAIILLVMLAGYVTMHNPDIPKTWDMEKMQSLELPLPDTSVHLQFPSEEYYYGFPEKVIYKTYPVYLAGKAPAGYYEWLKQQEPQVVFDPAVLTTEEDWIKAGEYVFDLPIAFQPVDSVYLEDLKYRSPLWQKMNFPVTKEGVIVGLSYTVSKKGEVTVGRLSCGNCHTKLMPDGSIFKGAQGNFPVDWQLAIGRQKNVNEHRFDTARIKGFNSFTYASPWVKHTSQEYFSKLTPQQLIDEYMATYPGLMFRAGTTPGSYPVTIPDLYNIQERKYFDRSGLMQHRDISDLMRYATLNQDFDYQLSYGGFTPMGKFEDTGMYKYFQRYSDAQLYALAKFIYSLTPPGNPNKAPQAEINKGRLVFEKEQCSSCHTPPYYSSGYITPAEGFTPSKDAWEKYRIEDISVGTDPGLTLYTRRGTGYYKIPSLVGAWNRTGFMHSGYVKTLEEMFDKQRLNEDYVPKGYKPARLRTFAVKGHEFGLDLNEEDRKALIAFIKSL